MADARQREPSDSDHLGGGTESAPAAETPIPETSIPETPTAEKPTAESPASQAPFAGKAPLLPPPEDATVVKSKQSLAEEEGAPHDPAPTHVPSTVSHAPGVAPLANLIKGQRLGGFELEDTLGVGGMATVLRARDVQLDRPVALKILPPEMAASPDNVLRFHNEARSAAKLDHEHIARVYSFGSDQGLHFIAYEFVEGETLRALIQKRGRLPVAEALRYALQIAQGLAHAAERGVVHRDIKPSNILIAAGGKAKLVDLGLARSQAVTANHGLTHSGVTLGTFDYISPEQAMDPRQADCRSDLYSLGCTLYHALTGCSPVPQGTALRKLQAHQHDAPLDPRDLNPEVPEVAAALLSKLMAKEPKDRFQHPRELVDQLEVLLPHLEAAKDPAKKLDPHLLAGLLRDEARPAPGPLLLAALLLMAATAALCQWLYPAPKSELAQPYPEAVGAAAASSTAPTAGGPSLQRAADAGQLAALLRGAPAGTILLTGAEYVLDAGLTVEAPDGLTLRAEEGRRPRLKLAETAPAASGRASLLALARGTLRLEGLRLETPSAEESAAVVVEAGALVCEDCLFAQPGAAEPEGAGASLPRGGRRRVSALGVRRTEAPSSLEFRRCVFAGGDVGVQFGEGVQAALRDCVVGPHRRPLLAQGEASAGAGRKPASLLLSQSACIVGQAAILLDVKERARLELRDSVFAPRMRSSLVRTLLLFGQTDPALTDFRGEGNAYCQLDSLAAADAGVGPQTLARTPEELAACLGQCSDVRSFAEGRTPWAEPQELDRLAQLEGDALRQAVRLRPTLPSLRGDGLAMRGPQALFGMPLYGRLEAPPPEAPILEPSPPALGVKEIVVDGVGRTPGAFATVEAALAAAPVEEDATLLLKVNGALPVRGLDLGGRRVTMRGAPGYAPELAPHPDGRLDAEGDAALFRLGDGTLTLEQLAVRLTPALKETPRLQSLAAVAGAGKVRLRSCQVTLLGDDDLKTALAALGEAPFSLGPMRQPMGGGARPGSPAVEIVDCLVRGRGELVQVRQNRHFLLEVRNSAVALQGSLLALDGVRRGDMEASAEPALVQLEKVSVYVTQGLIWFRATASAASHVPVKVDAASHCLFATGEGQPLIRMDGPRGEAELKRRLQWRGKRNLYATTAAMLAVTPMDRTEAPQQYDSDRWAELWGSSDEQPRFARGLRFAGGLETRVSFEAVAPAALRALPADPGDMDLDAYGADLDKVFSREAPLPMSDRR